MGKKWKDELYRTCLQTEKANDIYSFARIILYIEEHVEENLKSEDAAAEIGMSRSYFSTRFKEMTGDTFHNYVISRKMNAAACKMEKGTENITQIASDLGYDNYYYLQKCLQKNMDAHQQNMQTGLKNVRFDSDIFLNLKKRL